MLQVLIRQQSYTYAPWGCYLLWPRHQELGAVPSHVGLSRMGLKQSKIDTVLKDVIRERQVVSDLYLYISVLGSQQYQLRHCC